MNKILLKDLILASYNRGVLDSKNVARIADKLDRTQLKQYIKALKKTEKFKNVYVESPFENGKMLIESFQEVFPDKKMIIIKNSSLIAGVKINYNDDIFEVSIKNNLDKIINSIQEDYD